MRPIGVGMCLTPEGAALAVVVMAGREGSLAAVADVTWPPGLWACPGRERDAASDDAARLLRTARRRLALPRRSDVVVTGVAEGTDGLEVTARVAAVMARAGLDLAGVMTVDQAHARRDDPTVHVPPELREQADARKGALAVAAALWPVSGDTAAGVADVGVAQVGVDDAGTEAESRHDVPGHVPANEGGWVVEYVGELSSPS